MSVYSHKHVSAFLRLCFYPMHPDSPGPEHLQTQRHKKPVTFRPDGLFLAAHRPSTTRVSPLSAVLVAGLAPARLVWVLPDHRVPVSHDAVGAAFHAVRAVLSVSTLDTLVRTLQAHWGVHLFKLYGLMYKLVHHKEITRWKSTFPKHQMFISFSNRKT